MCNVLHVTVPKLEAVVSALMRQGYRVSRSHTDPTAIKTDAPNRALWDVMRCWANSQVRSASKPLSETSPAHAILSIPPLVEADFTPTKEAQELLAKKGDDGAKLGRFMPNPDEWGPGSRHTSHADAFKGAPSAAAPAPAQPQQKGGGGAGAMLDKRERNQGKRAKKRQRQSQEAARQEGTAGEGDDAPADGDAAADVAGSGAA